MTSNRFVWTAHNGQFYASKRPKDYDDNDGDDIVAAHDLEDEELMLSINVLAKIYPAPHQK